MRKVDNELLIDILKVIGQKTKVRIRYRGYITRDFDEEIEGYIDHMNDGCMVWVNRTYRAEGDGRYWQIPLYNIGTVKEL